MAVCNYVPPVSNPPFGRLTSGEGTLPIRCVIQGKNLPKILGSTCCERYPCRSEAVWDGWGGICPQLCEQAVHSVGGVLHRSATVIHSPLCTTDYRRGPSTT